MTARFLFHSRFPALLAGMLLSLGLLHSAGADAPQVRAQVPGYHRIMLGEFEVTALHDGNTDVDEKLLRNISEADIRTLADRAFTGFPPMQISVNEFLINTGSKLVLIDTGGGSLLGPSLGNMMKNIRAAGYDPDRIDAVLISHMHGDHVAGLLKPEGTSAFPKATIYASKPENDFWLSPAEAEKATADRQRIFKTARETAAPYMTLGRWRTFDDGTSVFPGIKAIVVPGHTPGHTLFEVTSGDRTLMIIGDSVHIAAVQFARPDAAIDFDIDPKQAVVVRYDLFRKLAESKTLTAASHLPFPGIGRIHADDNDTFTWVPVMFSTSQE